MWGAAGSRLGVYATPDREIALAFALGAIPDKNGRVTRVMLGINPVQLIYVEGHPNLGGKGYLYQLRSDRFEQIDALQWVSQEPVTPVDIMEINVDDYLYLFRYPTADDLLEIQVETAKSEELDNV